MAYREEESGGQGVSALTQLVTSDQKPIIYLYRRRHGGLLDQGQHIFDFFKNRRVGSPLEGSPHRFPDMQSLALHYTAELARLERLHQALGEFEICTQTGEYEGRVYDYVYRLMPGKDGFIQVLVFGHHWSNLLYGGPVENFHPQELQA